MKPGSRHRVASIITALLAILAVTTPTPHPAAADPRTDPVQQQVDAYLAEHPGGEQINATEISYGGGVFIVTVVREVGTLASPDCPSGWFCFYDDLNYGYPRGKLSSCGWQDLAWWAWHDRTESVHYNLSTGSVWFINHGEGTSHSNDVSLFDANTVVRARADVSPYRNVADHVYRYC